jgi:type IV secretory pathway component VirB8
MIDDEAPGPEYGEWGSRIVELRIERELRKLLTVLIVFGVLIVIALLALVIVLSPALR